MILDDYFASRRTHIINLGFREDGLVALRKFLNLLWQTNEDLNLFSRKMTVEEFIDNHVIDCLLPLKFFPGGTKTIADFGTGGGLPGIIYAIHFQEAQFVLFEKSVKKQNFLKRCHSLTQNFKVEGEIAQDLSQIDLVVARGFKPIDVILDMSRKYHEKKGRYFLLKGRRNKVDEEILLAKQKFKTLGVRTIALSSPVLEVERHLVIIE